MGVHFVISAWTIVRPTSAMHKFESPGCAWG